MATFRKLSEGLIEMTHEQQYTFYRTHPKYESPVSLIPIEITKHNGQHSTEALVTQPSDLPAAQPPVTPTQGAPVKETAAVAGAAVDIVEKVVMLVNAQWDNQ